MKKINFLSIALIGACALLTAACVEEITSNEEMFRPKGSPIVFSAATSYDNGVATRAVYSGKVFGTNDLYQHSDSYERIDWEKDDPVRLFYNSTPDNYLVADAGTASNEISKAELTGGSLQWDGSGSHLFYGLYPSGQNAGGRITSNGEVTGYIPATQNVSSLKIENCSEDVNGTTYTYDKFQPNTREYGYLVARETVDANSTASNVTLRFKPAFTTFEFKFNRAGSGAVYNKLMSATLATESVDGTTPALPLAGIFQIKLTGTDTKGATWNTETTGTDPTVLSGSQSYPLSTSITVSFGENGVEIPSGNSYLDFSVLCLPIELKGVKLILTFEGGGQKVLRFKDNSVASKPWYTFAAARKYVITNVTPTSDWVYVIEEILDKEFTGHNAVSNIGFNVKSYKYSSDNPNYKVEVPWHIEYSTDGTSYGTNAATYSHVDFQLSGLPDSATGVGSYTTGENRASNIIRPNPNYTEQTSEAESISRQILQGKDLVGTPEAPYDLSMYDIHGNARSSRTTANSYVVSAPGYYKFPVVYGNAITNGADNKSAYDPYSTGAPLASHWDWVWNNEDGPDKKNHDVYMTEHFYNALNQPISSPYVLVDVPASNPNAVLVWQDTDLGDEIIGYGADDLKLVGSGADAYIQFYIPKNKIHQGNIVLAVRDGSNEEVLWSWQIWVCEKDLKPITSRNLMPYNLGWIDQSGLTVRNYTNRVSHYRIVQDETGGTYEDFKITQIGDENAIPNNTGYNTFYEWGRKDPITSATSKRTSSVYATQLAAWGDAANLYEFPNTIPLFNPPASEDYHNPSYAYGITHPWIPMQDPDNNGWVNGQFYPPYEQFWHTDFLRGTVANAYDHDAAGNTYADHVPHKGNIYRKISGCPFNLWNSYAYGSADFTLYKYKTVYDPCPPGFCVPSLGTFAGIESASLEVETSLDEHNQTVYNGINVIFANGDAFFLPFSGSRGTRKYGEDLFYRVNDRGDRGVYWVDAPSAVSKSNAWTDQMTGNDWSTITANHGGGWWWYQFAKSLHIYKDKNVAFPDEVIHTNYVKYSPEIGHWNATNQTQRVGFDDVRSNAFSIRPVADPMY